MADDLDAPLGQEIARKRRRIVLPFTAPQLIAGVLGLFLVVFALWTIMIDDPLGGEPVAIASISSHTASEGPKSDQASPAAEATSARPDRYDGPPPAAKPAAGESTPGDGKTVTIIDGTSGKRQEVVLPAGDPKADPKGEQRLLETTRHGMIPRIGDDGVRPLQAYAQPSNPASDKPETARIALVISGLGVGASTTTEALAKLPGAVTLAFAPYGTDLDRWVSRARAQGHEVLLQAPMEPFDYPDNDPGPQTLLTSLAADQNIDRRYWLMSRFQGYVGIMNYMGARFTASDAALAPVLREIAKRGLLYVDDGSSPRSLAAQIAGANSAPFVKADVVLDTVPTPTEIDRALTRLETIARERGLAVASASALPAVISRLAAWSKAAEKNGFTLVPITVAAAKAKSS